MTEIKESFVYFNFETLSNTNLNCFTEKSLLGFLSYSLPVIYLDNEKRLKEYEDMGFYLFNKELDYECTDDDISKNISKFVKCIEKYNNLSLEEIVEYYNKNITNIRKNYEIVFNILFNKRNNKNKSVYLTKEII